jgi:hypothetical protein
LNTLSISSCYNVADQSLVALLDGAERKSEVKIQLNNEGYGKVILVSMGKLAGLEANVELIVTSEETS